MCVSQPACLPVCLPACDCRGSEQCRPCCRSHNRHFTAASPLFGTAVLLPNEHTAAAFSSASPAAASACAAPASAANQAKAKASRSRLKEGRSQQPSGVRKPELAAAAIAAVAPQHQAHPSLLQRALGKRESTPTTTSVVSAALCNGIGATTSVR